MHRRWYSYSEPDHFVLQLSDLDRESVAKVTIQKVPRLSILEQTSRMNVFLQRLDSPEIQAMYANVSQTWTDRQAALNSRLKQANMPVRVAGMETVWTVLFDLPGRYHWMLQYYLREQGIAMSWVGSGRMIMSLNFDDAMFDQFCERFVQAAQNMQQEGWWWTPALDQQRPIRRQVFKEMLKARWA